MNNPPAVTLPPAPPPVALLTCQITAPPPALNCSAWPGCICT
ncbi:MAG: hypothetical protein WDN04_06485 [Rhodospirillales bacterium]